jgi:hypothetical protein
MNYEDALRHAGLTPDVRLHQLYLQGVAAGMAVKSEPVAWMHTMIEDVVVGHRPADLNVHPDRWIPLYKDPTPCQTCEALARTVMMDQTAHDTTPTAQPAPEQYTALEQALTRLQKRYGELEAKLKEKNCD